MLNMPNRAAEKRGVFEKACVAERVQGVEYRDELVDREAHEDEAKDCGDGKRSAQPAACHQEETCQSDDQQANRTVRQGTAQIDGRRGQALFVQKQSARQPGRGKTQQDEEAPARVCAPDLSLLFDDGKL